MALTRGLANFPDRLHPPVKEGNHYSVVLAAHFPQTIVCGLTCLQDLEHDVPAPGQSLLPGCPGSVKVQVEDCVELGNPVDVNGTFDLN